MGWLGLLLLDIDQILVTELIPLPLCQLINQVLVGRLPFVLDYASIPDLEKVDLVESALLIGELGRLASFWCLSTVVVLNLLIDSILLASRKATA